MDQGLQSTVYQILRDNNYLINEYNLQWVIMLHTSRMVGSLVQLGAVNTKEPHGYGENVSKSDVPWKGSSLG